MSLADRELSNRLVALLDLTVAAASGCADPVTSSSLELGDEGDIDMSDCCDGGHAYVRVVRLNAVRPFPQPTQQPRGSCPPEIGALVEVGIIRCVSPLDENGDGPDAATRTSETLRATRDASIIASALLGHKPSYANYPVILEQWRPIGATGGCAGGAWQVWVDVSLCECGADGAE